MPPPSAPRKPRLDPAIFKRLNDDFHAFRFDHLGLLLFRDHVEIVGLPAPSATG